MNQFVVLSVLLATTLASPRIFSARFEGRVVGGEDVDIVDFPYQVSLQWYGSHNCGGSIIGPRHIVTAAHCTESSPAEILTVRAGTTIRNRGGIVMPVAKIFQHPLHNSQPFDYDITVLELVADLPYGPGIGNIQLPEENLVIQDGSNAVISGWGSTSEEGSAAEILQAVTVQIVDRASCNEAYDGMVTDRMVCAGVPQGGKGSCFGDSGGPLTVDGLLVGIVSWGRGCAQAGYPAVFVDVSSLRGYIRDSSGI